MLAGQLKIISKASFASSVSGVIQLDVQSKAWLRHHVWQYGLIKM